MGSEGVRGVQDDAHISVLEEVTHSVTQKCRSGGAWKLRKEVELSCDYGGFTMPMEHQRERYDRESILESNAQKDSGLKITILE